MRSIAEAALSAGERSLLTAYVAALWSELGDGLSAVWLFGSRARGEHAGEESDIDILVLVDDDSWTSKQRIRSLLHETGRSLDLDEVAWSFSIHIHTGDWLRQRRAIHSFFITEVDRDKVVVAGSS